MEEKLFFIDNRDVVTSTNDLLIDIAKEGEKEGYVMTARAQTAGKGRKGRSFFSYGNNSIYMSILLRPRMKFEETLIITPAAAVAVSRAIKKICHKNAYIKWVNDIFVDNLKVCGILTEASIVSDRASASFGEIDYAIVGIGVNVFPFDNLPDSLSNVAGSIYDAGAVANIGDAEAEDIRKKLILTVVEEFFSIYKQLPKRDFMQEYRDRSMCLGKEVYYYEGGILSGQITVKDITDDGKLVAIRNGEQVILDSGEVSIKL